MVKSTASTTLSPKPRFESYPYTFSNARCFKALTIEKWTYGCQSLAGTDEFEILFVLDIQSQLRLMSVLKHWNYAQ